MEIQFKDLLPITVTSPAYSSRNFPSSCLANKPTATPCIDRSIVGVLNQFISLSIITLNWERFLMIIITYYVPLSVHLEPLPSLSFATAIIRTLPVCLSVVYRCFQYGYLK